MQCLHINIRRASFILLSFLINSINMVDNQMNLNNKELSKKNNTVINKEIPEQSPLINDFILRCPSDIQCNQLPASCIKCDLDENCIYGDKITTTCRPKPQVKCIGPREIKKKWICRYCYQTDHWEHKCELKANCDSAASPRETYVTNCTVSEDIVCLGHRTFKKNVKCNWTGGYRWSTALALSVTLGGFGADRFYLGHWQEGIGKLFSFGGLGVWTLIDVILISLHYLGPADGSLYI